MQTYLIIKQHYNTLRSFCDSLLHCMLFNMAKFTMASELDKLASRLNFPHSLFPLDLHRFQITKVTCDNLNNLRNFSQFLR